MPGEMQLYFIKVCLRLEIFHRITVVFNLISDSELYPRLIYKELTPEH